MKSFQETAKTLGFGDPPYSANEMALKLKMKAPFSLRELLLRGSYDLDQRIRDKWAASGWEKGPLGNPKGATLPYCIGCYNDFDNGSIIWSEATGAMIVLEPIIGAFKKNSKDRAAREYNTVDYFGQFFEPIGPTYAIGPTDYVQFLFDTLTVGDGNGIYIWVSILRDYRDYSKLGNRAIAYYYCKKPEVSKTGVHVIEHEILLEYIKHCDDHGFSKDLGYPIAEGISVYDAGRGIKAIGFYQKFEFGYITSYLDEWTKPGTAEWKIFVSRSDKPFPDEFYKKSLGAKYAPGYKEEPTTEPPKETPPPAPKILRLSVGGRGEGGCNVSLTKAEWKVTINGISTTYDGLRQEIDLGNVSGNFYIGIKCNVSYWYGLNPQEETPASEEWEDVTEFPYFLEIVLALKEVPGAGLPCTIFRLEKT